MAYHIANIVYNILILYWHIYLTLVHVCAKIQSTATSTSHICMMYMQDTNMSIKLHLYAICVIFSDIYGACMCTYVHILGNWHQPSHQKKCTHTSQASFLILALITEQIWLPHCNYMLHCCCHSFLTKSHIIVYMCQT